MKRRKKNKKPINLNQYYTSFSVNKKKKPVVEVMCRHYDQDIPQSASYAYTSIEVITPEHRGISPADETEQLSYDIHESLSFAEGDMWNSGGIAEDLGFNDDDYVEVLESTDYQSDKNEGNCGCNDGHKIEKVTTEEILQPNPSPSKPEIPTAKTELEEQLKAFSDDDLLADMQSIIRGEKIFDKENGGMMDRGDYTPPSSSPKQQTVDEDDDSLQKLLAKKKNEHAIFDKIAESMQYANAYDLGSISVDKRFEEFDQIEALSKPKTKSQSVIEEEPMYVEEEPQEKVSSKEFIEDLDLIHKELSDKKNEAKQPEPIPLDPGIGGMSIPDSELKPGDIILSTTSQPISKLIRDVTNSEVSHAAIYVGDGFLVEAGEEGVLKLTLDTALAHSTVAAAYRHVDITDAKRAKIIQFVDKAVKEKSKFDYKALIKLLPSQLMKRFCESKPQNERESCMKLAEKMKFGTNNNNQFYCSELVVQALKAAELDIAQISPDWNTVQDIVELNHNGNLYYLGHLKS